MKPSALLVAALLTVTVAGCGADEADSPVVEEGASWRTSTDAVDPSGLVWAVDSTVHLADGSEIDVQESIGSYLVAGDGVFFFAEEAGEETPSGELTFVVADGGEPEATGLDLAAEGLAASPDGRYLAGIVPQETSTGPTATVVVYDLSTPAWSAPTVRWAPRRRRSASVHSFAGWVDDRTVLGNRAADDGLREMMTCEVPRGECTGYEGTAGNVVLFPLGRYDEFTGWDLSAEVSGRG